jgi:hypothetical protein
VKLLAALAIVVAIAAPARADDDSDHPLDERMRFIERGDVLTVTTNLTKLFDSSAFQALSSGFVTNVEIRIWVYSKDSKQIVAETDLHRSVVYDMWDEVYTIKPCETCKPVKVKSPAEALKLITSIEDLPVANLNAIPFASSKDPDDDDLYFLALRADLNPVDKKTLTEVRRWLSQSNGGGLDRGGTIFGSFVSVFVNPKIAEADRVLRVRSQPFFRRKP